MTTTFFPRLSEVVITNFAKLGESNILWISPHPSDYIFYITHEGMIALMLSFVKGQNSTSRKTGAAVEKGGEIPTMKNGADPGVSKRMSFSTDEVVKWQIAMMVCQEPGHLPREGGMCLAGAISPVLAKI